MERPRSPLAAAATPGCEEPQELHLAPPPASRRRGRSASMQGEGPRPHKAGRTPLTDLEAELEAELGADSGPPSGGPSGSPSRSARLAVVVGATPGRPRAASLESVEELSPERAAGAGAGAGSEGTPEPADGRTAQCNAATARSLLDGRLVIVQARERREAKPGGAAKPRLRYKFA